MREKIKLFNTARPVPPERVHEWAAFGRYGKDPKTGEPAYVDEQGVDPARRTETFAATRVEFDNWRWAGVPFYLRSGKKLAAKQTEVVVQFRAPPTNIFRSVGDGAAQRPPNRLIINIAPREGISLRVEGKVPGSGLRIDSAKLNLDYQERFGGEPLEAYGPLILDAVRGDQTLFKHREEVESGWMIIEPVLKSEELRRTIETYAPGTWGPSSADALLAREGREWHNPAAGSGSAASG
jgi:glucose-6-phosphate 1-dehydrogenase